MLIAAAAGNFWPEFILKNCLIGNLLEGGSSDPHELLDYYLGYWPHSFVNQLD